MNIQERKEEQAKSYHAIMSRAQAYSIGELFLFHQLRYVVNKTANISFTKKGPGRKHKQGARRYV